MPLYDYEHAAPAECANGHVFEVFQKIAEPTLRCCPLCGANIFRRISAVRAVSTMSDTRLKNAGFAKLVKRDASDTSTLYENVTAQSDEARFLRVPKNN